MIKILNFKNRIKKFIVFCLIVVILTTIIFTASEKETKAFVLTATTVTLMTAGLCAVLAGTGLMLDKSDSSFSSENLQKLVEDFFSVKGVDVFKDKVSTDFFGNVYIDGNALSDIISVVDTYIVNAGALQKNLNAKLIKSSTESFDFNLSTCINLTFCDSELFTNDDGDSYRRFTVPITVDEYRTSFFDWTSGFIFNTDDYEMYCTGYSSSNNTISMSYYDIDLEERDINYIDFTNDSLSLRTTAFPFQQYLKANAKSFRVNNPFLCYMNGSIYFLPAVYSGNHDGNVNYYYVDVPINVPNWPMYFAGYNGLLYSNSIKPVWGVQPTYEYSNKWTQLKGQLQNMIDYGGGLVVSNNDWSGVANERELLEKTYGSIINLPDATYSDNDIIVSGDVVSTAGSKEVTKDTTIEIVNENIDAVERENSDAIANESEWNFNDYKVAGLAQWFPFCVPFDLYYIITLFNADAVTPKFEFPINLGVFGSYTFDVDLSDFDKIAYIFRIMMFIGFLVGLTILTRHLIRG